MLFGAILMIQLLAHLPLANIDLSSNALQTFDIMISVVSFDYFQPTEYLEVDFTETDAYTENFATLGYESSNFVEGMGSILVFAFIQIIMIVLIVFTVMFKITCPLKWCKKNLTVNEGQSGTFNFI